MECVASHVPPPLAIFADGCSASTSVLALAADLLRRFGVPAALPVFEPMLCSQNTFCHSHEAPHPIVAALQRQVHWGAERCQPVLLKGHCGMDDSWPAYARSLQSLGARVAMVYRRNVLDVAICEVRDCLNRDRDLGTPVRKGADAASRPPPANCSISRRSLPRNEQPRVWLDPMRVVGALRRRWFRNAGACLRSTWPDAPRFSVDALLGFERAPIDAAHDAALNASARAWSDLLARLGASHASVLRARRQLVELRTRRAAVSPPPPHAQLVANAAAVRAALAAAGPPLARLWRD
jgi:hypothetical protein